MDIELADAVAALRDELLHAASRGAGRDIEFAVGPIQLDFAVELRKDMTVKTGFKAWVVSGDVEGKAAHVRTHRLSITLTPRPADGGDLLISDEVGSPAATGTRRHLGR